MADKRKTRSPLERKPLRNPGESLHRKREELVEDELTPTLMFAAMMVVATLWEWGRWYFKTPPYPLHVSVLASLAVGYGTLLL